MKYGLAIPYILPPTSLLPLFPLVPSVPLDSFYLIINAVYLFLYTYLKPELTWSWGRDIIIKIKFSKK